MKINKIIAVFTAAIAIATIAAVCRAEEKKVQPSKPSVVNPKQKEAVATVGKSAVAAKPSERAGEVSAKEMADDPSKMTREQLVARLKEIYRFRQNILPAIEGLEVKEPGTENVSYIYKGKRLDDMTKEELIVLLKITYQQISVDNMRKYELQQRQLRNLRQIEQMNKQDRMLRQLKSTNTTKTYNPPKTYSPPKTYKPPAK
jgi:hypothetical protein